MIRLRRYIFATLTVLSLSLFLTTLIFWARSYWRNDLLTLVTRGRAIELATGRGRLLFASEWNSIFVNDAPTPRLICHSISFPAPVEAFRLDSRDATIHAGFSFAHGQWHASWSELTVPFWFLCLVFAITPTVYFVTQIRRRRRPAGFCKRCGYDLRATPDRCPECGTMRAKVKA